VLLILTYDENGEPNPPSLLSAVSDEVLRESLWRAVEGAIRPGPSRTDPEVLMFLGDGSGPQLRRVDDFASCQPQIQNGPELQRQLGNLSRGLGLTRPMATTFRVQVRIDGSSGPAQIERSSGDSLIDDQARLIVEAARWSPAMIEGVPIPTTAQFPVRFIPVSTPGP